MCHAGPAVEQRAGLPPHQVPGTVALLAACLLTLALLAVAMPALAHKGHTPAAAGAAAESLAVDSARVGSGLAPGDAGPPGSGVSVRAPYPMPPMRDALLEHPHNKLVHLPLALALAAALLMVLGHRRPELEVAARWLVWLAAIGGVAAYFTGRIQEEAFHGEPKEWVVALHEKWGLATVITLGVWALLTLWKPARRLLWLPGLVAAALVLITGFYGGIVAHGE